MFNSFNTKLHYSIHQHNENPSPWPNNITNPLTKLIYNHIIYYPTPNNIGYTWSFGSLAGLFFAFQLLTGIFLAMHYCPNIEFAFWSVEHIMRDINNGWFFRYAHANGASIIFITLYVHIAKAIYFKSYLPGNARIKLFYSGIIIFLLMMATAFIGYVLPYGQMSYWGATVITNLLTVIPGFGEQIAYWVWGDFAVGNPTLNRFFSIHYTLPFIILAIIFLHLTLLHLRGSSNPIGINSFNDKITFYPYFYIKDGLSLFLMIFIFIILVFFYPNILGHSDNYIMANPLVTPTHIVPEWYFLPFYAILRAIPNKTGGVVAMLFAILILFLLPFLNSDEIKSPRFNYIYNIFFIIFISNFITLGYLGQCPAEAPYIIWSQLCTTIYFIYFFINPIFNLIIKYSSKN